MKKVRSQSILRALKFKKTIYFFLHITILAVIFSISFAYAYWPNYIAGNNKDSQNSLSIGEWDWGTTTDPNEGLYEDYNIDIWIEEENINHSIPEGQIFSYEGYLYISLDDNYNPEYHGLPGAPNNQWAYVSTELEWAPNLNYRVNSVVTRNGRWFIANSRYNTTSWFVNDPLTNSSNAWSEWREIEPMSEENFAFFPNSTLIDYASPDWDYVIYK